MTERQEQFLKDILELDDFATGLPENPNALSEQEFLEQVKRAKGRMRYPIGRPNGFTVSNDRSTITLRTQNGGPYKEAYAYVSRILAGHAWFSKEFSEPGDPTAVCFEFTVPAFQRDLIRGIL